MSHLRSKGSRENLHSRTSSVTQKPNAQKGWLDTLSPLIGLCSLLGLIVYLVWPQPTYPISSHRIFRNDHIHPILSLLHYARSTHIKTINSQSKTLTKAISEYRKRYGRPPPSGYADWFEFALARNHTLLDEYDQLTRDLEPFRQLTPVELALRTRTMGSIPGVTILSIKGGKSDVHSRSGRWAPALAFQEMIAPFIHLLPDMELAINEKLEGRVLPELTRVIGLDEWFEDNQPISMPFDNSADMTHHLIDSSDPLSRHLPFAQNWRTDGSQFGSTWETFRRACPPDSAARRLHQSLRSAEADDQVRQQKRVDFDAALRQGLNMQEIQDLQAKERALKHHRHILLAPSSTRIPPQNEMTFVSDTDTYRDICNYPSLHSLHSAFYTNTRPIPYLYPLFSPSKPNGYADILIPSHQYWSPSSEFTYDWEMKQGRTKTTADVDWSKKDDVIYWRGKVTRGAETPLGREAHFQKQRLVSFANEDSRWTLDRTLALDDDDETYDYDDETQQRKTLLSLNPATSVITSASMPLGKLNDQAMDIALTCDLKLGECQDVMRAGYRVDAPKALSQAWKHKYVLDVDEIGLSPKFLALMESKCALVKSTVQREFWNDWIVPWYHYIPLSSSFLELHNIQSFFSGFPAAVIEPKKPARDEWEQVTDQPTENKTLTGIDVFKRVQVQNEQRRVRARARLGRRQIGSPLTSEGSPVRAIDPLAEEGTLFDGDRALQDIGAAGSRWKRRHMRRDDMQVYVYRLMIEWSDLLSPDRQTSAP